MAQERGGTPDSDGGMGRGGGRDERAAIVQLRTGGKAAGATRGHAKTQNKPTAETIIEAINRHAGQQGGGTGTEE